jgi:hypothetical protein
MHGLVRPVVLVYRRRFLARDSCGQDVAAVSSSLHSGRDAGSGWSGTGETRTAIGMNLESGGQFGDDQNEIYFDGGAADGQRLKMA